MNLPLYLRLLLFDLAIKPVVLDSPRPFDFSQSQKVHVASRICPCLFFGKAFVHRQVSCEITLEESFVAFLRQQLLRFSSRQIPVFLQQAQDCFRGCRSLVKSRYSSQETFVVPLLVKPAFHFYLPLATLSNNRYCAFSYFTSLFIAAIQLPADL